MASSTEGFGGSTLDVTGHLVEEYLSLFLPEPGDANVVQDGAQPRADGRRVPQLFYLSQGYQKGVVHGVLGFRSVAQHTQRDGVERRPVALE